MEIEERLLKIDQLKFNILIAKQQFIYQIFNVYMNWSVATYGE
jgi:hypothetical protein